MKFHIAFTYRPDEREKLMNFLQGGGLEFDGTLKLLGCWIAVQTGNGYALIETQDAKAIYEHCSRWSEYGQVTVTPVVDAAGL